MRGTRRPARRTPPSTAWPSCRAPTCSTRRTCRTAPSPSVHYNSTALGGIRRMHVYTPPGYETGRDRYPVFYLLHGAGDVDESWSSVGRAGFILDNLIAANKAKPMIVVMPAGHVNGAGAALGGVVPPAATQGMPGIGAGPDPFANDFNYRPAAVYREELPRVDRPPEPRDRRPLDGRQPDAQHRDSASREVRVRRRLQLRGHQRRTRRGAGREHAVRARPGRSRTWRPSTTPPPSEASTSSGSAPAKTTA